MDLKFKMMRAPMGTPNVVLTLTTTDMAQREAADRDLEAAKQTIGPALQQAREAWLQDNQQLAKLAGLVDDLATAKQELEAVKHQRVRAQAAARQAVFDRCDSKPHEQAVKQAALDAEVLEQRIATLREAVKQTQERAADSLKATLHEQARQLRIEAALRRDALAAELAKAVGPHVRELYAAVCLVEHLTSPHGDTGLLGQDDLSADVRGLIDQLKHLPPEANAVVRTENYEATPGVWRRREVLAEVAENAPDAIC